MGGEYFRNMKTAFIFPGQGAQFVGMGKDLYEAYPKAKAYYDNANDILGYDLRKICFDGPADILIQTKYSQPAILVTSLAYLAGKIDHGTVPPSACAGLSLGEYTALIFTGAIEFADGLKLVAKRAEFMQEDSIAVKGGMSSVIGMEENTVREIVKENGDIVDVANLNCPGQVVISGLMEEILKIAPILQGKGARKVIPLDVSGPFHSRYMKNAQSKLEPLIKQTEVRKPMINFYANVTGEKVDNTDLIREYMIRQVASSVYWEKTIRNMQKDGIENFEEVGPGNVLAGLLKRILK
jgi:[acyl-carrier-protein] S-malonyltransferase